MITAMLLLTAVLLLWLVGIEWRVSRRGRAKRAARGQQMDVSWRLAQLRTPPDDEVEDPHGRVVRGRMQW